MSGFEPRIKAVLGPTNTGKTHLAMERLLAHSSGIIGFPLRLLARENYDRMVARKGARHVALITGEEKIVPPTAHWFSCTAEAMPLDRPVEFVAVDEIQLCADPDRGHVFTDRLLHARGLAETMFLGAETIRPLLRRVVRQAEVETRPRLSRLTHAGPAKLTKLPPRTAIVAFSAADVYAIAELIRRRRGGCAVVMGRLSPRTRNAQVALYQDQEVDFLVATDAIGMGLNMDVDHVAFAGLSKHDGHRARRLAAAEVAQIAGRAGRGMRDGTFGTTATCPDLPEEAVVRVEDHRFEALEHLCWRNSDLDFSHIDALLASLSAPPPERGLVRGDAAADQETLAALVRDPEVRRAAQGRRLVRLLWEACQIPDFRKLADETHNRLCARIFFDLARGGRLADDWLRGQIDALARPDGDIDTLMQRLAGIRIWSYITARTAWVRDGPALQARARKVEDLLSDALHERLTARFVDRRAAVLMRRLDGSDGKELLSAVTRQGEVVVEGHPVGTVGGFIFYPDPAAVGEERRLVLRAARRALHQEMPHRVAAAERAEDAAFVFGPQHTLLWNGTKVARLRAGETPLHPQVVALDSDFLDGAQRERLRRRLQRWVDERVRADLAPLFAAIKRVETDQALRGPLHRLEECLGVAADAADLESALDLRRPLKVVGVRVGRFALFFPALLKPRPATMRAQLWAIWRGHPLPTLPAPGRVSIMPPADWPPGFAKAIGWLRAGPVLVRLDVAERVAAELSWATRAGAIVLPPALASRFSVPAHVLPAVLHRIGFRAMPAAALAPGMLGPPASPMLAPERLRRNNPRRAASAPSREAGPFSALASLVH